MPNIAVINGKFMPLADARVSVEDRGFLFGDGIYELVRSHDGQLFGLDEHLRRMKRSAEALRLDLRHSAKEWKRLIQKALERSGIPDSKIYIEVTRGAAPRSHTFPKGTASTTVITVRRFEPVPDRYRKGGAPTITAPDVRWGRCDIKSLNLLPNILAKQRAFESGAFEAIFIRSGRAPSGAISSDITEGAAGSHATSGATGSHATSGATGSHAMSGATGSHVTEGTSSNVFAVFDDTVVTSPQGPEILSGVTREMVLDLAKKQGLKAEERSISDSELLRADEVFLTGTTMEVLPVSRVDETAIGKGKPGKIAQQMHLRLMEAMRRH